MFFFRLHTLAFLRLIVQSSSTPISPRSPSSTAQILYQFPNQTWVENIAVRVNNHLLLTLLTSPDLYSLDPSAAGSHPTLIHSFPDATSLFGITETEPDVFAIIAGNFSLAAGAVPGTSEIWKVDFSASKKKSGPKISKIAAVPQATFLNGMCTLPEERNVVLLGDIGAGEVYRLDTRTGITSIAIPSSNSLVSDSTNSIFGVVGVNGLHVIGDELYVANTGKGVFGKLKINPDGSPAKGSQPVILEHAANGTYEDDFALDDKGNAFLVTGSGNSIIEVSAGGQRLLLAGDKNSTEIAEPTSVALSRNTRNKKLYVVTAGGLAAPVDGDMVVGGQVLAIELGED